MFTAVAMQSGIIVLREGLEVVVVLAAMASLIQRQAPGQLGSLWIGAGLGLAASLLVVGMPRTRRGRRMPGWSGSPACWPAG